MVFLFFSKNALIFDFLSNDPQLITNFISSILLLTISSTKFKILSEPLEIIIIFSSSKKDLFSKFDTKES